MTRSLRAPSAGRKGTCRFLFEPIGRPFCVQRIMNKILSTNTSHLCTKSVEIITCNVED